VTERGPYPYAGVPWYSTPFARDGLLTTLSTLWPNPDLARGVLAFLSATRAREEVLDHPHLPGSMPWVRLTGLRVGPGRVDLLLRRERQDGSGAVLHREGPL